VRLTAIFARAPASANVGELLEHFDVVVVSMVPLAWCGESWMLM